MEYSPDAYLLHESNRFITFNIRIKVVMKDPVVPDALKYAAEKAFVRFPYYSKQIHIDEDGGIDLVPNPRNICVSPVSRKKTYLFSKEVNYQPCSIEYEGMILSAEGFDITIMQGSLMMENNPILKKVFQRFPETDKIQQ